MPGDDVVLGADAAGRLQSFVAALTRFPITPAFVVVGGFAVNVRISQVHRLTNDLDAVTANQAQLVQVLLAEPGGESRGHAKVRLREPAVDVDIMDDTARLPLPSDPGDRAFALARRHAMETRTVLSVSVVNRDANVAVCEVPFASTAALVMLKAIAMPRRAASPHPEKVASDALDLVRLVESHNAVALAEEIASAEADLGRWVARQLIHLFGADADQRYTIARVRRMINGVVVDERSADEVALVGELVRERLEG